MFNSNIVGRWMAVILAVVGCIYLAVPLITRGPVGHIPLDRRPLSSENPAGSSEPAVSASQPRPKGLHAAAGDGGAHHPDHETAEADYLSRHGSRLDDVRQHPDFSGDSTGDAVAPPETRTHHLGDFTLHVPVLDEQHIERANYASQVNHLLAHLSPENLDGALQQYSSDYRTLLDEMGLRAACVSGACGLRLGPGGFLEGMSAFGLREGDELLSLNGTLISDLHNYEQFKSALFGHAGSLELGVMQQGEMRSLRIPVDQPP